MLEMPLLRAEFTKTVRNGALHVLYTTHSGHAVRQIDWQT
jgi:hypothetical protein